MKTIEKILLFGAAAAVLLLFDFVGRIAVTLFVPLSTALPTTER
jgi:hypothetical protein